MTGAPKLALNSGASVSYASGSGGSILTFNYTLAAGQTSSDLDYSSNAALTLNGGTIKDAAANVAVLTLADPGAAGSLGANKNIVIDAAVPTVAVDTPIASVTYGDGPLTITGTAGDSGTGLASVTITIKRASDNTVLSTGSATNTGTNFSTWSYSYTPSEASNQTVSVVATDVAGNIKAPAATAFSVARRPITVTVDAKDKLPGVADPSLTYQVTGGSLAGSDSLSGSLTRAAGETIGVYAISQGTLAASSNYTLSFVGNTLAITGVLVNDGAAQRSMITSIKAVFAQPIAGTPSLSYGTGSTNTLPSVTPTASSDRRMFTYTFGSSRVAANAVQDGIYKLTLADAGTGQSLYKGFHSLFGDSNGDGTVSNLEILSIRSATYVSFMDYNGDGVFTAADYNQALARRGIVYRGY